MNNFRRRSRRNKLDRAGLILLLAAFSLLGALYAVTTPLFEASNGVITPDGNNNLAIHTPREQWPWRGPVLAAPPARRLSVLLSASAVYCPYRLTLETVPGCF